jgi:hypothetical protein
MSILFRRLKVLADFKVDMAQWPRISRIEKNCMELDAFKNAAPMMQIDAA